MKTRIFIAIAFFLGIGTYGYPQVTTEKITLPLRFDHYYTYEQVVEALKALHAAYPSLTGLDLVGKSEENREIWALTINNPQTGNALDKPGVYLDGNIHGNEIQAGEVCLYFAEYMLKKYSTNDKIKTLVDRNAYYIIPVVNVDGRYHFFSDPNTPSTNRGLRISRDDDKDGLFDEDFPDDLDGDGNITMMRKNDPFGRYKTDPEDPRLMVSVKPGEKGEWTILSDEGIDNDNDGRINEDSEGYVDGNRNWGYNWAPDYVQNGSGDFPFQGSGIKAIAEYMMKRPNIIMVYAFHNNGGMYLRGPGTKDQPEFPRGDLQVYDYLGKHHESIVPGYRYLISWKDLYATYGDFTEFTDNVLGSYSLVGELFPDNSETYKTGEAKPSPAEEEDFFNESGSRARERLKFNDNVVQGDLYSPWKPYKHPVYGDIEIGGWIKYSSRLPHPFMLPDLVHRNAAAVMFSARQTPDVKLEVYETKKIGKDLYRIRVRLSNPNVMPSVTYNAIRKKTHPQDILKVGGKNITMVSGGRLNNPYTDQVSYKKDKPEVQMCQVPGFGKVEYQFLVSGKGTVDIDYQSIKAGKRKVSVELK